MRRRLIQTVLPLVFCLVPALAAFLIAAALPGQARNFYLERLTNLDALILGLGCTIFFVQMLLAWTALQWRGHNFDERPDRWLSNLAQAAEWFPLLGLIGTVAGILQTFSSIKGPTPPAQIIQLYAARDHGHRQRPVHGAHQHLAELGRAAGPRHHPLARRRGACRGRSVCGIWGV